jgi:hypothetical protein
LQQLADYIVNSDRIDYDDIELEANNYLNEKVENIEEAI